MKLSEQARKAAERCIKYEDIFGLDRKDTAEQRLALLRARIADAITSVVCKVLSGGNEDDRKRDERMD